METGVTDGSDRVERRVMDHRVVAEVRTGGPASGDWRAASRTTLRKRQE